MLSELLNISLCNGCFPKTVCKPNLILKKRLENAHLKITGGNARGRWCFFTNCCRQWPYSKMWSLVVHLIFLILQFDTISAILGFVAPRGSVPFLAVIKGEYRHCTGSMIHPEWILTSSWCVEFGYGRVDQPWTHERFESNITLFNILSSFIL